MIYAAIIIQSMIELIESVIDISNNLSLEARAKLQKKQDLDLTEYIYDFNTRKQLARSKRTINIYESKQKKFIMNCHQYISTDV